MAKVKDVSSDRAKHQIFFEPGSSLTKQSFRDECNINHLMAKYARTGLIDHVNRRQGNYSDVSMVQDYHSSIQQVELAHDMFMELPSSVRAKFRNDPGEFIDFVSNPDNEDEMRKLGLLNPVSVVVPDATEGSEHQG